MDLLTWLRRDDAVSFSCIPQKHRVCCIGPIETSLTLSVHVPDNNKGRVYLMSKGMSEDVSAYVRMHVFHICHLFVASKVDKRSCFKSYHGWLPEWENSGAVETMNRRESC